MSDHRQRSFPLFGEAIQPPEPPKGRMLVPPSNQPRQDLHMTPPELARRIVDYFAPRGRLLDPCRGDGAFYNAMLVHSADVLWCEVREGRNFFAYDQPIDWIITNPPWSILRPFTQHALRQATDVVFLVGLNAYTTKARLRDIERAGFAIIDRLYVPTPPSPWPGSGFQLAAVHMRKGGVPSHGGSTLPMRSLEVVHG